MAAVRDVPNVTRQKVAVRSRHRFFLEGPFHGQKAASKLLNDPFMLPYVDKSRSWLGPTRQHGCIGLEPMRASLANHGLPDARTVSSMKNGVNIRYAGLVICRQRPGTAGGVVFMTLEDETGFVNVVVWESVFQRYSVLARTVSFLGITGKL